MRIILVSAGPPARRLVLDSLPAMIGRDVGAEVCIEDSWVGRYQCIIDREGDTLRVLDLGSRVGTFVNGVRIQRATLRPGDMLTLGRIDFLVQCEHEEPASTSRTIASATDK